ncbi:hypothetical protein SDC9_186960 [bioreactor metagenome]|uniref:UbiC transcription regulator-associated domain-containing protein n=1 Tax=bioreactor metagenome TaxID=1076179 RepID=A0A645HLW3_9ZZZZ
MLPRTDVLALKKIPGNPVCNLRLELPEDEPLIYLKRIRYADDEKVVFLETYVPFRKYSRLMEIDFTTASLYSSLESLYGVRANRARREIEAVTLNQDEAKLLDIPIHKAVCLVTSVAYAEYSETPVEYSIARYRGDRTKFAVETLR